MRPTTSLRQQLSKLGVLLSLTALVCLSGCKEQLELHSRLSESDANEVIAALIENHIIASKQNTKDGVSVLIDESDIAEAVKVLNARGLPRKDRTSMGEVFQKEGIISSPLEERARYIYALSQELEYTFSQITGVVVARVHVVLPEKVAPGEPIQPSSAAVFIKHQNSLDPDVALPKIRRMVASSIPGLAEAGQDSIAVVFMPTEPAQHLTPSGLMRTVEHATPEPLQPVMPQTSPQYALNIAMGAAVFCLLALLTYATRKLARPSLSAQEKGNSPPPQDT